MSKTSTHNPEPLDEALIALVGAGTAAPIRDAEAEAIAGVLGTIRAQLLAAAREQGVSTREMARRLGVSAVAVSRQLRSDRDLRVSTAVLLARALDRRWSVQLGKRGQPSPQANLHAPPARARPGRGEKPADGRVAGVRSVPQERATISAPQGATPPRAGGARRSGGNLGS